MKKRRALMDPDLQQRQNQLPQASSGLTRYQSAPSSYFSNFLDDNLPDELFSRQPLSPETEGIFARLMSGPGASPGDSSPAVLVHDQSQFLGSIKNEPVIQQQSDYSSAQQNFYQSQTQQHNQNSGLAMDYRAMNSTGLNRFSSRENKSNLIRQASSPAGLFADIRIEHGMLAPIAECENKNDNLRNNYVAGFGIDSWDEPRIMSGNLRGLNRIGEEDEKTPFSGDNQSGEGRQTMLAHHMSLPNTLAEISAIEKLLQFQDSVPCKIRAKRGFATHPRSIAERVRRTRISERMRKLEELVPNMEKQTNTADMLDLAVDYIKDLQQNLKALLDKKSKCICSPDKGDSSKCGT